MPGVKAEQMYVCRICGKVGLRMPPSPNALGGCVAGAKSSHSLQYLSTTLHQREQGHGVSRSRFREYRGS
jgi:hypothetical protein